MGSAISGGSGLETVQGRTTLAANAGKGRLTNDALIAMSAGRLGITVITANGRDFGTLAEFRAVMFLLLLVLFWRHNRSAYKRLYSQWERLFLCQRCGTLTEEE